MSTSPAVTRFCLVSIKLRQVKHIPGKKQKQLGVEAIQQLSVTKKNTKKTLFQHYYGFIDGPF